MQLSTLTRIRFVAVLAAVAVPSAFAAAAGSPEDAARTAAKKAVKSAVKTAIAAVRITSQASLEELGTSLAAVETTITAPPGDLLLATAQTAGTLEQLQFELGEAMTSALEDSQAALTAAGLDFSNATQLPAPDDLLFGGGGALDRLPTGLRGAADKALVKARTRFRATLAKLAGAPALRTTFLLETPRFRKAIAPNVDQTVVAKPPLTIDTLVAVSQASDPFVGALHASGQCDPDAGAVSLTLQGSDSQTGATNCDAARRRWAFLFNTIDLPDAGNETIRATQGTDAPAVVTQIGIP